MLCANGVEIKFEEGSGIYFICQTINKGNQCRFCRFCNQTGHYIMITDKNGLTCDEYSVDLDKIKIS